MTVAHDAMKKDPRSRSNLRTALVLGSIALAFFIGIVINRWLVMAH